MFFLLVNKKKLYFKLSERYAIKCKRLPDNMISGQREQNSIIITIIVRIRYTMMMKKFQYVFIFWRFQAIYSYVFVVFVVVLKFSDTY